MTLGEELCRKYALTSLKGRGSFPLMAINEALEAATREAVARNFVLVCGGVGFSHLIPPELKDRLY